MSYHEITDSDLSDYTNNTRIPFDFWDTWNHIIQGTTYYAIRILSETVTAFCKVEKTVIETSRRVTRLLD